MNNPKNQSKSTRPPTAPLGEPDPSRIWAPNLQQPSQGPAAPGSAEAPKAAPVAVQKPASKERTAQKGKLATADKAGQITFAEAQHIGYGGQRQSLEDRCVVRSISSAAGLEMVVGIVADGIGGASAGEAAGQLTIDTIVNSIQASTESDVNAMLANALQVAHQAVKEAARANPVLRSMGTTATVAAVAGGKLYLVHVGDSRAYLVREGQITQLTMDHTWGNERVREGQLSLEQAARHPRRDDLARYVGQGSAVSLNPDIGLRLDKESDPSKSTLVQGGLEMQRGDVVVLCTDGLIKDRRDGSGHFVEPHEIIAWVQKSEPQDAANTLVSLALGRQVDDNVSVVLIEMPGKKKKLFAAPARDNRSLATTALLAVGAGILLLFILLLAFLFSGGNQTPEAAVATDVPLSTATAALPKPPAGTVQVLDVRGDVRYDNGSGTNTISAPGNIPLGDKNRLWTGSGQTTLQLEDGSQILLGENTTIYVPPSKGGEVEMERGRLLVLAGAPQVRARPDEFQAWSTNGAMMGVTYNPAGSLFRVDCFGDQGDCNINSKAGYHQFGPGQALGYEGGSVGAPQNADFSGWRALSAMVPEPTATPTPTDTLTPTPTETPTNTLAPGTTPGKNPPEPPDKPPQPPPPNSGEG